MLMVHVSPFFRHKSSFSYLPPLLTGSATISTHTQIVSPQLLLFHLLQNTERGRNFQSLCDQRAAASLSFPGQNVMGNISWYFGVFQFLLPLERLLGRGCLSPTNAALQLPDHISLKNPSAHLTALPQPNVKREFRVSVP